MKVILAALAVALSCAAVSSPAIAAGPPPTLPAASEAPVPAAIVAAHPGGRVLHALRVETVAPADAAAIFARDGATLGGAAPTARRLAGARRSLASGCWRAYFQYTDNSFVAGRAETHVNPLWCGNGSTLTGVDNSWHYLVCTNLIACLGSSGPYLGSGCARCSSAWYTYSGQFSGFLYVAFHFVENVAYGLYGNGQSWSYGWENH